MMTKFVSDLNNLRNKVFFYCAVEFIIACYDYFIFINQFNADLKHKNKQFPIPMKYVGASMNKQDHLLFICIGINVKSKVIFVK